jgi:hypothetical protein
VTFTSRGDSCAEPPANTKPPVLNQLYTARQLLRDRQVVRRQWSLNEGGAESVETKLAAKLSKRAPSSVRTSVPVNSMGHSASTGATVAAQLRRGELGFGTQRFRRSLHNGISNNRRFDQ